MKDKRAEYKKRHKALGLCLSCPEKAVTKTHCEKHQKIFNEYSRREYALLGPAHPRKGTTRCSRCGKPGHNKRRCKV